MAGTRQAGDTCERVPTDILRTCNVCGCSGTTSHELASRLGQCRHGPRLVAQSACIGRLKDEEEVTAHRPISWHDACLLWVSRGYAERFARLYRQEADLGILYARVAAA